MGPDCTMTLDDYPESQLPDGSKYNDCGDYFTSCTYFVFFQVFDTFDMINSMIVLGFASYFDNSFLQLGIIL